MAGYSIVSSRYAESFIQLAKEQGQLEPVNEDMKQLLRAFRESDDLRAFLRSPVIAQHAKEATLKAVFEGKISKLSLLFILKLVDARREALLGDIAFAFIHLYKKIIGMLTVSVRSAVPLNDEIRNRVLAMVKQTPEYAAYPHMELEEKVEPGLIGGLIITVGDNQIDASFARQIRDYKKVFSENPYVVNF